MRRIALPTILIPAALGALAAVILAGLIWVYGDRAAPPIEVATAGELARLFDSRGYAEVSPGKTAAPVPRLLLATLPGDLGAMKLPAERKALFLRLMLPLVLAANEEIAGDRAQLVALADRLAAGASPGAEQAGWLAALARRYRVVPNGRPAKDVAELLRRVDAVPPSLAIAQAALESGWGTSRLARQGNALFGERTWTAAGLAPLQPIPGERHRARSFERLLDAVRAYALNLNSHPAYAEFRRARAQSRADGAAPGGASLARYLTRYSELGSGYTRALRDLIRANRLERLDGAVLQPEGTA